ncbi:bifunctional diguanylate cyclase/phosphodiesterase [Limnohabitans sp. T6-20]|uniref:putative bifunctional diguanylate cyclase/phosphodiesterase n=1 Tax=Limnohabitans sp. T6-20 TaxID=1100725 RepID=UPI000D3BAADB|nr:EAL domain-containing protein [Limnohabitans sp. T6-20]PUE07798.1 PAS domain S-box protein [Limnohabitans sp. T6-20]
MGRLKSLKAQISHDVFRLFSTYILGVTSISVLLAIYGIFFYQQEEFKHYKALLSTRLDAELSASFRQANDLAHSPEVWTGLTDSEGRGSYLLPLLEKANQNKHYQFELLDYLGRFFIQSGNTSGLLLGLLSNIEKTIEDSQTHLGLATIEQSYFLTTSVPVMANFSDSAIGVVLLYLDLDKIIATLDFPDDLKVNYSLTPFVETASDLYQHNETFKFAWTDAGKNYAIHIQLQQSYLSAFVFVMSGLAVSLVSGVLLFVGLKRWTRVFSERTTQRLNDLVQLASDTVQGRGDESRIDKTGDEISKVSNALQSMLQKQRLATQKQAIFSRVFETAAEAILITNKQGLVVDVNAALTDMTGYTRDELINQPAGRLYIYDSTGVDLSIIAETVRKQGSWRGETYFLSKQKTQLPVLLSVSTLLDAQGMRQGHVSVFSDIRAIREAEKKLKDLLHEDQLTGLPNYRGFLEYIKQKVADAHFAILFIDLDNFKNINDTFGHDQGDEVIRQIAQHLKATLPADNFLCRRSGDEFIAVLDVHEPIADFQNKLKLVFKPAVFTVNHMGTVQITATFSAGAALFPDHSESINELLVYADTALLSAKDSGRNQIKWLNAQMMSATSRKTKVDSKLAIAIREGRIFPHYQPEVDLRTGKIIGFEALARWQDEELGMVSPAEFIPLAEQSGAIDPLTQSLFSQVVKDSQTIRSHFPNATIALNSSPQLLSGKRLFTMLSHLSSELENGLEGFVLEITETDFSLSPEELASQLQAIMGLGVRIAIDDFGKSYSSLSRLASMPLQKLKIDMSFIAGMKREENTKIISGILALARSLGLEVTAEGVENRYQKDVLVSLGCEQAQGYFYSKPLNLREVIKLPTHLVPEKACEAGF